MATRKFKDTSNALAHIWGHTGPSGTGSASQRGAVRAGVKIDTPLTPAEIAAQEIADELSAEDRAAARAADPRSPIAKLYDIRDGAAHMSPQQFYDLMLTYGHLQRVRAMTEKIILRDTEGLDAEFTLLAKKAAPPDDWRDKIPLTFKLLRQMGIGSALHNIGEAVLSTEGGKIYGLLKIHAMPTALAHHARQVHDAPSTSLRHQYGQTHDADGLSYRKGNAAALFKNTTSLAYYLSENPVIPVTITAPRESKIYYPLHIGKLYHPAQYKGQTSVMAPIPLSHLWLILNGTEEYAHRQHAIKRIYNAHSGYMIHKDSQDTRPLAYLVRPWEDAAPR